MIVKLAFKFPMSFERLFLNNQSIKKIETRKMKLAFKFPLPLDRLFLNNHPIKKNENWKQLIADVKG